MKKFLIYLAILIIITALIVSFVSTNYPENIVELCLGGYQSPEAIELTMKNIKAFDYLNIYDIYSNDRATSVYSGNLNIISSTIENSDRVYYRDLEILKTSKIKGQKIYISTVDAENITTLHYVILKELSLSNIKVASSIAYIEVLNTFKKLFAFLMIVFGFIVFSKIFIINKNILKQIIKLCKETQYDLEWWRFIVANLKIVGRQILYIILQAISLTFIMYYISRFKNTYISYSIDFASLKSIINALVSFTNLLKYYFLNGFTDISWLIVKIIIVYIISSILFIVFMLVVSKIEFSKLQFKNKKFLHKIVAPSIVLLIILVLLRSDIVNVSLSKFTKQEMLDDYDYFWSKLEKNWVYFDAAQESNIDLIKIKNKYRRKISQRPSDKNFYNSMRAMADEISSSTELGKVYAFDSYLQAIYNMEMKYKPTSSISSIINNEDTIEKYKYIDKLLKIKPIDSYSLDLIKEINSPDIAEDYFNKNIQVKVIVKDKIASIKINSMFISNNNELILEVYKKKFEEIYKNLSNYKHIIFDLSDCVGTSSYLWEKFIVAPNISFDKYYSVICAPSDDPSTHFTHRINVESSLYEYNILKAKKWIITSKNTRQEAKNFVNFAKETKFATIVGENLGSLELSLGLELIKLPKLDLVLAYDKLKYLDSTEANKPIEIIADVESLEPKKSLDVCLNKITEYERKMPELTNLIRTANDIRKELILAGFQNFKAFDEDKFTPDYRDEINAFSEEEIDILLDKQDSRPVTKQEALEDIDTLFRLYKYTYSAYYYFGGDSAFNGAKNKIIQDILSFDNEEISYLEFRKMIAKHLNFIQDGHHTIRYIADGEVSKRDDVVFYDTHKLYIGDKLNIVNKSDKYYINLDDNELLIENIAGDVNLDNYIKSTINDDGKIVFGLFSLFANQEDAQKHNTITAINKDERVTIDISWTLAENGTTDFEKLYEKKEINGVPVYTIHKMIGSKEGLEGLEERNLLDEFSNSAKEARNHYSFIIDLRGNTGGNSTYAHNWFYNYCGSSPISAGLSYSKSNLLDATYYKNNNIGLDKEYYDLLNAGKWSKNISTESEWYDNNNIIIVLVDNYVTSSAEYMVSILRQLDNVIFIGSNTSGAMLTPGNTSKYLPNSKLFVYYGSGLSFTNSLDNIDCKGFMPDIWVNPKDALEKAIQLCNYYSLNR